MRLLPELTKRKYFIAVASGDVLNLFTHSLEYIFTKRDNDFEYIYAIHDMADELLDLKVGESIYFQPDRDNKLSKGIITRNK